MTDGHYEIDEIPIPPYAGYIGPDGQVVPPAQPEAEAEVKLEAEPEAEIG